MMRLLNRARRQVLVLDDDASMRRLVATLLQRAGYRVDVVSKGLQAIEAIDRKHYDALLLDVMMPTEGAMTVLRHLRETKPELMKRVILVTATPESVLRSVRGEVAAIVHKPFTEEALLSSLARLGEKVA